MEMFCSHEGSAYLGFLHRNVVLVHCGHYVNMKGGRVKLKMIGYMIVLTLLYRLLAIKQVNNWRLK